MATLCGQHDTNFLCKRKVLSLTDDPIAHTVSLLTAQASLADCLSQGSVRLTGDFATVGGGGLAEAGWSASIPLDGTVIYDNGTIKIEITTGQITFDPGFTVSGDFQGGRLVSFDAEVSGTAGLDMTVQATAQVTGDWDGSEPLTSPKRTFKLLGFVGFLPVWVEAVLEFNIGYEAHLQAQGTAMWGLQSSRTLTFGARLRNGQWRNYAQQDSNSNPFTPRWQINGAATVQGYVEPKLTVYLESQSEPRRNLSERRLSIQERHITR